MVIDKAMAHYLQHDDEAKQDAQINASNAASERQESEQLSE
jgi:hypothetical protein